MVVYTSIINVIALFGAVITTNIIATMAFIFVFGLTYAPRASLTYVWALELTTRDSESHYSMLSMLFDSMCLLVLGLYFLAFHSMAVLLYLVCAVQTVAIVLMVLYIPESPSFLYEKGDFEGFLQSVA